MKNVKRNKLSIIVATIGHCSLLPLINSIEDELDFIEFIVVHQIHGGEHNVEEELIHSTIKYKYIIDEGIGVSRARNIGLQYATSQYVTFADDDCCYSPKLVASVIKSFANNPSLDVLSVYADDENGTGAIANMQNFPSRITIGNVFQTHIEFSLFFRANVFAETNIFFDESMGVGSHGNVGADEGPDLLIRLMKHNVNMYFEPSMIIYHPSPFSQNKDMSERGYKYNYARSVLINKYSLPKIQIVLGIMKNIIGCLLFAVKLDVKKSKYHFCSILGRINGCFHHE